MMNAQTLKIEFREKRKGLQKVITPFFHEDGDMYDIFVEECDGGIKLSDYGLTAMRLSYSFDAGSERKKEVMNSIITQNRCSFLDGEIFVKMKKEHFEVGLYQIAQAISKVSNMDILDREIIRSLFYEQVADFMQNNLNNYRVTANTEPEQGLIVDYTIEAPTPIYLFAVKDDSKAYRVVISCLQYTAKSLHYKSVIVHENFEELNPFNRNQITDVADKQFTTFETFKNGAIPYFEREVAA